MENQRGLGVGPSARQIKHMSSLNVQISIFTLIKKSNILKKSRGI